MKHLKENKLNAEKYKEWLDSRGGVVENEVKNDVRLASTNTGNFSIFDWEESSYVLVTGTLDVLRTEMERWVGDHYSDQTNSETDEEYTSVEELLANEDDLRHFINNPDGYVEDWDETEYPDGLGIYSYWTLKKV